MVFKITFFEIEFEKNKQKSRKKSYFFSKVGLWCFRVQNTLR